MGKINEGSFDEKVWQLLKKIPRGRVTTYGLIAKKLNSHAYRAVGQACRRNENAPQIPCHRVVNANGFVGYYSGEGGMQRKIQLLKKEGIKITNKRIQDFDRFLYRF